jgi:hypothetical protein
MGRTLESCQAGPARLATGEREKKYIKTKRYVLLPRATGSSLIGALQGNSSEAGCGEEGTRGGGELQSDGGASSLPPHPGGSLRAVLERRER